VARLAHKYTNKKLALNNPEFFLNH